jgi:hypothetical protein
MEYKREGIDLQAVGLFIIGSRCRRQLKSRYMDTAGVSCTDIDSAACDR